MSGNPTPTKDLAAVWTPVDVLFGGFIRIYTRRQAIADGVLIDASRMAREVGFLVPVAVTAAAWADCVAWSEADSRRQTYQDEAGRLWDVLGVACQAARRCDQDIRFQLYRVPRGGRGIQPTLTTLKAICGPGDEGEPVVTIMLPDQG